MGNNDFTINGKVVMDTKEFQAFINAQKKLEEFRKQIETSKGKRSEENISRLEKEIKLLKELEKSSKKDLSNQIRKKENTLEQLKTQMKLNELQKDYNKAKEELDKKTKINNLKSQIEDRQKEAMQGKSSFTPDALRLSKQIGSWHKGGVFEFLADKEEFKGEQKLTEIANKGAERKKGVLDSWAEGKISESEAKAQMSQIDAETSKEGKQAQAQTEANVSKYQAMAAAAQMVANQLSRLGKKVTGIVLAPFKALATKVKDLVLDMIDLRSGVQTYATSSSLITNAAAREQQIKYGLSSDKNYAFTKAKELLNIQSDEDLMYMNKDQRDRLLQYMDQYSRWYQQMESSGVLESIQEMQMEWAELKEELSMEFLSWIAQNKDTIMSCVRGIFETIKFVANLIMGVVRLLGGNTSNYNLYDPARNSDTVNNTNNNQRSVVNNFNINTTNNATGVLGSPEALDQYTKENWSDLAKKVVGAIGG